ncbi:MAG: VOC family protein [Desulfobacterales bacterium]|nr:VOC family protein [Desulfobacteraceae bacterium]MBT4364122.1 VOC family protein [Desulfobacteraceae bacterium]MBT7085959.1 VOC family protein [Desulfobacterales bacterium]
MNGWSSLTTNMILYCKNWEETVKFYKDGLSLPVNFSNDWFVEFCLAENSNLSIANDQKSTIKSSEEKGITITLQVQDIDAVWEKFAKRKLDPTKIKRHPWNARVFYLLDPEGHRIEIWQLHKQAEK